MLQDADRLRELISEYGKLHKLQGYTPQTRGQRLNSLIADALQCYGIKAEATVHGAGEVDVVFGLEGRSYILEAKWEKKPVGTGHLAKFQKRIRQRLIGTLGIFLSMSGYSDDGLRDLKDGDRLETLLIDQEHLEALLAGMFLPEELIGSLVQAAAFRGSPYNSLLDLSSEEHHHSEITFETPHEVEPIVKRGDIDVQTIISNLPFGQHGVCAWDEESLLITLASGIHRVLPSKGTVLPHIPIPICSRNPMRGPDGSTFFVRRHAVAQLIGDEIECRAGALVGNVSLVTENSGNLWVFANQNAVVSPGEGRAQLIRLGDSLWDQEFITTPYEGWTGTNAAQISQTTFLIIGNSGLATYDLNSETFTTKLGLTNPMGLVMLEDGVYLVASDDVLLSRYSPSPNALENVAHLNLNGAIYELARAERGCYMFSHYIDAEHRTRGIVIRITLDNN